MPYIKQEERDLIDTHIAVLSEKIKNEGQLNYVIFKLCLNKVMSWGMSYSTFNKIIGVFECCKAEFLRRQVFPYEDKKIKENGDV